LKEENRRLGAIANIALAERARDVILHGLFRDEHLGCDFTIGQALRNEIKDVSFLMGEGQEEATGEGLSPVSAIYKVCGRENRAILSSHGRDIPSDDKG
jgi:hypothetical protein